MKAPSFTLTAAAFLCLGLASGYAVAVLTRAPSPAPPVETRKGPCVGWNLASDAPSIYRLVPNPLTGELEHRIDRSQTHWTCIEWEPFDPAHGDQGNGDMVGP